MRKRYVVPLACVLGFILLTLLVSACSSGTPLTAETATVDAAQAATVDSTQTATVEPAASAVPEPEGTGEPAEGEGDTTAEQVAAAVGSRTPVPTPTPGLISEQVDEIAAATGLAGKSFLGLETEDWINLAFSVLIVVLGYLLGVLLLFGALKWVVRQTSTQFDDAFLDSIGPELKRLVVIVVTRFALLRLDFLSDRLRTFIDDASFALGIVVLVAITLKLVGFAVKWYQKKLEPAQDRKRLDPIVTMVQRFVFVLVIIVGLSMVMSHFGLSVNALSAVVLVTGVVIILGAKDVVSDAISGFIILMDQPFRVGDSIEVEDLQKVGTVEEIGTRTTQIRTRDNRLVIVPNSKIGASQVVNYSYPDPQYRVRLEIGVAYGSDFDQVRRVVEDAVRGVDGVLPGKPVEVLIHAFGASSRKMRVRWWIDNVNQEAPIVDRVSEALELALDKAGIAMPFTTQSLIVQVDPNTIEQLSPSPRGSGKAGDQAPAPSLTSGAETE